MGKYAMGAIALKSKTLHTDCFSVQSYEKLCEFPTMR